MMAAVKTLFLFVSALFPIVDPLGGAPIFLTLTRDYLPTERRVLSRRIAMNSFFLLIGSYFIGTHILAFFGISLPVVQVGGGLVVISTAWTMLKPHDEEERSEVGQSAQKRDPFQQAFYPLTLPLTVGPGSISVAITLGANLAHYRGVNVLGIVAALIGSLPVAISIFLCYGFADRLARVLGDTAMNVIMRLTSFLLLCIGVQILWNGVSSLLMSLPLRVQ
jgi:multiple antibiotic resistance protein